MRVCNLGQALKQNPIRLWVVVAFEPVWSFCPPLLTVHLACPPGAALLWGRTGPSRCLAQGEDGVPVAKSLSLKELLTVLPMGPQGILVLSLLLLLLLVRTRLQAVRLTNTPMPLMFSVLGSEFCRPLFRHMKSASPNLSFRIWKVSCP